MDKYMDKYMDMRQIALMATNQVCSCPTWVSIAR